ncbi:MAG: PorT family protein [Muribaculaceae bacterium]|nr:PorT family protein [Muribaculaceae bacterium]
MKKITIALMCVLLTAGAATAQKKFTFGPKVGFDITHFWGEGVSHEVRPSYQAGLFMEYRATDMFAIAPEVVFASQGGKHDKTTYYVNYVNVPVMMKFYVAPAFSIDLGPQLGINVYSKTTNSGVSLDFKKTTKDVEFGVGLGMTYNITDDVFIQGRYTMGLTKVYEYTKEKNGNAQIAIGYRF